MRSDLASVQQQSEVARAPLSIDVATRTVRHIISTAELDRSGRVVDLAGWQLDNFKRNPIVLADHEYSLDKVIGTASNTAVEGDALVSTTRFTEEGLGNVAFRLVQGGFVRGWSVGWIGLKAHYMDEAEDCKVCAEIMKKKKGEKYFLGKHFTSSELLEYSLIPVPSNPSAVMTLQAAGLVARDEAEAWLKLSPRGSRSFDSRPPSRPTPSYRLPWAVRASLEEAKDALRKRRAFADAVADFEFRYGPVNRAIEDLAARVRASSDRMRGRWAIQRLPPRETDHSTRRGSRESPTRRTRVRQRRDVQRRDAAAAPLFRLPPVPGSSRRPEIALERRQNADQADAGRDGDSLVV